MKNKALKVISALCSLVLLLSCFTMTVFAKKEYQWSREVASNKLPVISNYNWYALGKAVRVEQQAKYFVVTTTAGQHTEQLYVSFPAEGGFRLQSKHEHQQTVEVSNVGLFEPESIATIDYKKDSSGTVIMTGADGTVLRFKKSTNGFVFEVCNKKGKKLLGITNKQISFAYNAKEKIVKTLVELPLTEKEGIYQGGERYNDTNQVGYYSSLTNVDAWSAPDYAYNNVPLFHSNRGYSVWFNMTYPGEADMGWSNKNKYALEFWGDKLDFYLWTGTPLENLKKYTDLTGTSGMYNEWTFGFWTGAMSAAFNNTRKQNAYENMIDLLEGYADNYNFYPESMYGEGQNSQYARNIQYQAERGIRTTYWYYPGSAANTMPDYLPGVDRYPVKNPDGTFASTGYPYIYVSLPLEKLGVYQFQNQTWYDYSNPSTVDITTSRMMQLWKWGVSGAMIDYGENLSFAGTTFNGLSGMEMHNLNSYYYAKHSNEAWQKFWKGDYVLYMRSGVAGSQYWSGNFLGDQRATWDGFMGQVHAMISLGASGFNLYGGDFCSLGGKVPDEMMSRWMTLTTFSPWMRQHGANIHMPWEQGEANKQNFGTYYYFRKNIVPTVMSAAMDANKTSNPIIKGMMMEYPYQLSLVDVNNQYLFCDDFLVCLVAESEKWTLDVSLPNGDTWYNLTNYKRFEGGQKVTVEAPTAYSPVFVRDGAVKAIELPESMVLGAEMHDPDDYGFSDEFAPHDSLLITPPDQERTSTIHVMDGNVEDFRTYESHTEVYTSKPVSDSTFTITNEEGSHRTTMLALGVTAAKVLVDGEELDRLDHMPDYFMEEYGYYVELSGLTTIYMPADWKEITIVKGESNYESYKMFGTEFEAVDNIFDGLPSTCYQPSVSSSRPLNITLAVDEPVQIGRIVARWAVGYYNTYDIEYSVDGENWFLLTEYADDLNTVTDGAGSIDLITIDPAEEVYASYLRVIVANQGVSKDVSESPSLYEFEVYPPDTFEPLGEDETPLPEYEEDDENWLEEEIPEDDPVGDEDEDEDDDDDDDAATGTKKKIKKTIILIGLPTWLLILIIAGGVLLLGGALLLILLLLKKKKKKEAAAAAQAAEESPTDFPGNE